MASDERPRPVTLCIPTSIYIYISVVQLQCTAAQLGSEQNSAQCEFGYGQ